MFIRVSGWGIDIYEGGTLGYAGFGGVLQHGEFCYGGADGRVAVCSVND
jgi:hypothetical protein